MWRQFVDDALRQLFEEFLFRYAGPLGERLDDLRTQRVTELTRRYRVVRPASDPRINR